MRQHVQFDSFGEPIPQPALRVDPVPHAASRIALFAGMGLFWSLVVAIVSARAVYFNPDFAATFRQAGNVARGILTAFGV